MRIAILHNALLPDAREDERDVLVQVQEVAAALRELGHSFDIIPVDLNLRACAEALTRFAPDIVFNLIESFAGSDQLVSLVVAVIESLGIPSTGSRADSLWLTNHKIMTKERLRRQGLPTPDWIALDDQSVFGTSSAALIRPGDRFLIKPMSEHSSLGMDESALVRVEDARQLSDKIREHARQHRIPCFAERFVVGREFNVSLLAAGTDCQVLPLAEIDFSAFPSEKPRIVDYKAKWIAESFEFQNTPRRFLPRESEPRLARQLTELGRQCWKDLHLRGYARVDFRIDEAGDPWILEVNTNPCLSPDAGFAAALREARVPFAQAIQQILDHTLPERQAPRMGHLEPAPASPAALSGKTVAAEANAAALTWRFEVREEDVGCIRQLVAETGFFNPAEVAIAEELVQERLTQGAGSGYHFVIAELRGEVVGYACYGHIAGTHDSYDLYWIAVDSRFQGQGFGRWILAESERCIHTAGGRRVYIETSNREQYRSTRGFYLRCGYACEATLVDFYAPGDDKVIYVRALGERSAGDGP